MHGQRIFWRMLKLEQPRSYHWPIECTLILVHTLFISKINWSMCIDKIFWSRTIIKFANVLLVSRFTDSLDLIDESLILYKYLMVKFSQGLNFILKSCILLNLLPSSAKFLKKCYYFGKVLIKKYNNLYWLLLYVKFSIANRNLSSICNLSSISI